MSIQRSVLEALKKIKVGQMVKVTTKYSWKKNEEISKGMVIINKANEFRIIPVYDDKGIERYKYSMWISLEYVVDISITRFSKEITNQLKQIHQDIMEKEKINKQIEELKVLSKNLYDKIESSFVDVQKLYIQNSSDVNSKNLLENMVIDINSSLKVRNERAFESNKPHIYLESIQHQEQNLIKICFSNQTGPGVFSKDNYDSQTQYRCSDKSRLEDRYCYSVRENAFNSKNWTTSIDKSTSLGDKGSIYAETNVLLTLATKKITKTITEKLKAEINNCLMKVI